VGAPSSRYDAALMQWFIRHAMRALYPRTPELPGIEDTDLRGFLARYRRESSTLMWLGLWLGTLVFIASPVLTVYLPVPSFLLPRRLLDRHAHRAATSRLYLVRQAMLLLKLAAGLLWGADPEVRACFAMAPYPPDPGTWRKS